MLRELRITNCAIIDELALSFAPGMNVLTGETGAGKSIITRSIALLCGERASMDLIRTDADEAEIAGIFDLGDDTRILGDCGLAAADELLVRRLIHRSGKGRVYINGSLATAGVLAQLGARLIHVYGQHDQALLLKPDTHLEFIDELGNLGEIRVRMTEAYEAFRHATERLAALTAGREAARQRLELLRFQVGELHDAQLTAGEEAALQQERERQRHAERLAQICQQGEAALYSGDEAVGAALGRIAAQLQEAARIDPSFRAFTETLQTAGAQVEDVALELRRAGERLQHDPERLEQIEERLALLARLKRKYECDADTLVQRRVTLEADLEGAESAGGDITATRHEALACAAHAWEIARALSHARQAAAAELERRMAGELHALGLRGAVFRPVFAVAASEGPQAGAADPATAGLSVTGGDVIEFYLSANAGEAPKALARIASGGELSRIMLALKTLTAGAGEVDTLIFDEVDTGISGVVAEAVGKRLHALAQSRQVLCITHLPQIAALADHHFAISKSVRKGRTTTTARVLDTNDRVRELARMLGGSGTLESQRYAQRLIDTAAKSAPR